MATIEVCVPDIGDFTDVSVIEVLVKPGDTVRAEQSLVTVESDKASMEIPSSHAGVVKEMKIKLGDTVSQGSVILTLEAADSMPFAQLATSASATVQPLASPPTTPAPAGDSEDTGGETARHAVRPPSADGKEGQIGPESAAPSADAPTPAASSASSLAGATCCEVPEDT